MRDEQIPLTFRHRAGVSPYTSSYDLAETCVFSKQSLEPLHCDLFQLHLSIEIVSFTYSRHPIFRSYGANLPSSLTRAISRTLGYSPRPPVSVYGTDIRSPNIEAFLVSWFRVSLCPEDSYSHLEVLIRRVFQSDPSTCLNRDVQHPADLSLLRHPIAQTANRWYRNIQPVIHRLRLSASA